MSWTPVKRTKEHAGQILPEIMLRDPHWFYYQGSLLWDHVPSNEIVNVLIRSSRIRIPQSGPELIVVQYVFNDSGHLLPIEIVPAASPLKTDYTRIVRTRVIDLSLIMWATELDTRNDALLTGWTCKTLVGVECNNLSRDTCEKFFNDDSNFVLEGSCGTPVSLS